MEELAEDITIYDQQQQKGISIDIIRTNPKKYRILIDTLYPGDM